MKNKILLLGLLVGLISTSITAQTNVSDTLFTNTTWSLINSPYVVTDDVFVKPGVTLTIEPGVEVRVDNDKNIEIEGILMAQGTADDKIVFTSDSVAPTQSSWQGIYIRPTGGAVFNNGVYQSGSKIINCEIRHANRGFYVFEAGLHIDSVMFDSNYKGIEIRSTDSVYITNSSFTTNYQGIYSESQDYSTGDYVNTIANTFIRHNAFQNNNFGIDLITNQRDFINLNIDHNQFRNNVTAIDFGGGGYGPRVHSVYIHDNLVEGNTNGINIDKVYDYSNYYMDRPSFAIQVFNNLVINNSGKSINLNSIGVKAEIYNNIVVDNVEGLQVNGSYTSGHVIKNNYVAGNNYGVKGGNTSSSSYNPTGVLFSMNTFEYYNDSILIDLSQGSNYIFEYNNFTYADEYFIKNTTANEVTASSNYWENMSDALVYDFNDDGALGAVVYTSELAALDTAAPLSTPKNVFKHASGGDVVVTWDTNMESDLLGYKIYYDSIDVFLFADTVDVGNTNSYTISGIDISTDIVVTAYDIAADNTKDLVEGHESWYSMKAELSTPTALESASSGTLEGLSIWPNPAHSTVNIATDGKARLVVSSINGQVLIDRHISDFESLDVSAFDKGLYVVTLKGESSNMTTKLVVH